MSKFKNILSRVILGGSRQKEDDLDYLCAGFERYMIELCSLTYPGDDNDDDGNSFTSFSTTSTADNLPGTGRTVDTYIYQPMGRRIERLAMRFTIASLHPAHVAQYMETEDSYYFPDFLHWITLNDNIAELCRGRGNGPTVVAGMKGLVKQTQSASALAALIRVSLAFWRKEIYVHVSRIEPILHLETLARSLPCSHPDRKWFLFLVKLARETLIAVKQPSFQFEFDPVLGKKVLRTWPSPQTALDFRQRLMRALRIYRTFGLESLEDTIGEACAIYAETVSTCVGVFARGDAYMHILETVYFTVVFILRSIHEIAGYAKTTVNRQIYMVLQTLVSWIYATLNRCYFVLSDRRRYDIDKLKAKMAFRSLVYGDATSLILPQSYSLLLANFNDLDMVILPRTHRETAVFAYDIPIVQGLLEASEHRTRRLLMSFNELEREVCGISLETRIPTSHSKIDVDPYWNEIDDFGDEWWKAWNKALEKARRVQVPENLTTEEFREARRIGLERDSLCDPLDWRRKVTLDERNWVHYQLRRGTQHKWGQYLRSNMDWDWDLRTCMNCLFKESHPGQSVAVHSAPASSSTIGVAASPEGALQLSFRRVQVGMPKEVQISYETEDGKMQYMSFVPATPGPGPHTVSNGSSGAPEDIITPAALPRGSGYREGSSGVKQAIEDLEAGASSSYASQPEACKTITIEECDDGCEGKGMAHDGAPGEVRAGGDVISICSLD